jgi:murein DD-endopeptidase MepM/ murein hydrolase activator NlpD
VIAKLIGVIGGALVTVASLPLLMVPGAGGPDTTGPDGECGELAVILDTIRTLESGGNYQARSATATASGAYQFIDATWRHYAEQAGIDTSAYPSAWMAPPDQQDAAAARHVRQLLDTHHGQIDLIPVAWYYPAAIGNPALLDQIPYPQAGNRLTIREYQTKWMTLYQQKLAVHGPPTGPSPSGCASTITADGQWALPAPRDALTAAGLGSPHHDYPAIDLMLPDGTPIYAVTAGVVIRTTHFNTNWWTAGCSRNQPPAGCATCGNGITIRSTTGDRYTYCHNRNLHAHDGDTITTGQHIADSGNTGRSGAPHLHLEIRTNNTRRCPQDLLLALYDEQSPPAVDSLPNSGCTF